MPYVILREDTKEFVKHGVGGFSFLKNQKKASQWDKKNKANNVIKDLGRSKKYKNFRFTAKSIDELTQEIPQNALTENSQKAKSINKPLDFIFDDNLIASTKSFVESIKGLEERKKVLNDKLRNLDLQTVDIEHAIEFKELSGSDGDRILKLFHQVRNDRRKIKNELTMLNVLMQAVNANDITMLEDNIKNLENPKYTPRSNLKLFND